ncbi:MAG: biotin/lipoyl-binding protein, partial [Pseudonocardia sp.]|nr:biotin/lipoyl-binding protein [Pseudonocardia sp.]
DGTFGFLEVNTRLQVEHPVTELVTGLDLVEVQLRVAEGAPLPPSVTGARIDGHAIEVRLYAEDVAAGFLPATGTLHAFAIDGDVRVDAGVTDGSVVGPHYDPMLAKVIAHGATRADAVRALARALATARIHGVTTNRDLLVGILREPEFQAGKTDTGYLTRHDPAQLGAAPDPAPFAVAAALAAQARNRAEARVLATIPSGYRNVGGLHQRIAFAGGGRELDIRYRVRPFSATVDGEPLDAALVSATPAEVVLETGGVRRRYAVRRAAGVSYVDGPGGSAALAEVPRFPDPNAAAAPGSLLAPMPGGVIRVLAEVGAAVTHGQPLVVLEAMKMEHTVAAPVDGVLAELDVVAGDQVDTGQVLAVVSEGEEAQA